MFEIGLTRIFSATIWYHFAFVAISVALLGWGLGGFALHSLRDRLTPSLDKAGAADAALRRVDPALPLVDRAVPVPARAAAALLRRVAAAVPAGGHARSRWSSPCTASAAAGSTSPTCWARRSARSPSRSCSRGWAPRDAVLAVTRRRRSRRRLPVAAPARCRAARRSRVVLWRPIVRTSGAGVFSIRSAPTKGMYRHMAAHPEARDRADRLERLLAHRRGRRASPTEPGAPLHRLGRLDRALHRWDGRRGEHPQRLRDWYRALPFTLAPQARRRSSSARAAAPTCSSRSPPAARA